MKSVVLIVCIALCCLLLCSCADSASFGADEKLLSEIRSQYRGSSLIVEGIGHASHIDADGELCYDLVVSDVYAGSASAQSLIHLKDNRIQNGESYLLFLGEGEDKHYAEDTMGYNLLFDKPIHIQDNEVVFDGKRLPLSSLKEEIEALSLIISAPAPVLYYESLSSLADAADEIVIGKVISLPELSKKTFSVRNGGNIEKAQYEASLATVEIYRCLKGGFAHLGDSLELVYSPERLSSMLDASTLKPVNLSLGNVEKLKAGETYLFFLDHSPDSKQTCHFLINPIQGFARVSGDKLYPVFGNAPLCSFNSLDAIADELSRIMNSINPDEDDAPLLIVEE